MSIDRRSSVGERQPLLNAGSVEANASIQTIVASDTGSDIVGWDSSEDSDNPKNWTTKAKSSIVIILTSITILSSFFSSTMTDIRPLAGVMFAPALKSVLASFGSSSETIAAFLLLIFVTGYAAGPLLWAPLSELYGRRLITNITNVLFLFTNLASGAAPSLSTLSVARFFGGFFGSACFVLGGGIINDVILPEFQGKVMAVYSFGALLSPVFGPMTFGTLEDLANGRGGYISTHFG
jgi:MFS family permease